MTTPAPDAPLVFPSVVFRPARLLILCALITALAVGVAAWVGHVMYGVYFGVGLALGLINALLVRRSVASITADAHPLKHKMAVNSATRLLIITVIGLTIAYLFRPAGLGALFGLALFQVILVLSTALPVWKKIRTGDPEVSPGDEAGPTASPLNPASSLNPASGTDNMFKD